MSFNTYVSKRNEENNYEKYTLNFMGIHNH